MPFTLTRPTAFDPGRLVAIEGREVLIQSRLSDTEPCDLHRNCARFEGLIDGAVAVRVHADELLKPDGVDDTLEVRYESPAILEEVAPRS